MEAGGELIVSFGQGGGALRRMFFQPILNRVYKLAASLAVDRGNGGYRAGPAVRVDECSDALRSLLGRDQDAKLFEQLFPWIHRDATLVPEQSVNPPGVNDAERLKEDLREMSLSQDTAAAARTERWL
jgi:hypothetical protein